jgi:hypothetical protein
MTGIESSAVETRAEPVAPPAGSPVDPANEPPSRDTEPAVPRRSPIVRLWRWLWGSDVESRALAALNELSGRQLGDLRRAFAVRELAQSALLSAGHTEVVATTLPALVEMAREAAFWSLAAHLPDPPPASAPEALARTSPELLSVLLPDEAVRERVRLALAAPQGDAVWARRPAAEQEQAFRELGALSTALLERLTVPRRRLRSVRLRRAALAGVVVALALAAQQLVPTINLKPSLTEGRPWQASSTLDVCKPKEHWCADAVTDIFFCTADENNPWVEFDLGDRKTFSRLVVKNRSDCCPDRAVPLVLEVSDDRTNWREVARRDDTFSTWRAKFPATRARYARLRVLRRSILHLDKFDLYR